MTTSIHSTVKLQNGVEMPWLGLGVWKVPDEEATSIVQQAIETGYRAVDTAAVYGNEAGVGRGIKASGVARDQIFVTTKVWNADQGYEQSLKAFDESLNKLELDHIDLLLIHWPVKGKYVDTWRALEEIYRKGHARAIGVSNFHQHHLEDIAAISTITPMVNQVEYHPLLAQESLRAYCQSNDIRLTAWSPLMQGNLDIAVLQEIGSKYGKSAAQVVLRWDLQNGVITIPKTSSKGRLIENSNIFDFQLTDEDMGLINALNQNKRFGPDPDNFDF